MELLLDLIQTAVLGYLAWRQRQAKAPDLRELVKQALIAKAQDGTLSSGRERLRAHLAARLERRSK